MAGKTKSFLLAALVIIGLAPAGGCAILDCTYDLCSDVLSGRCCEGHCCEDQCCNDPCCDPGCQRCGMVQNHHHGWSGLGPPPASTVAVQPRLFPVPTKPVFEPPAMAAAEAAAARRHSRPNQPRSVDRRHDVEEMATDPVTVASAEEEVEQAPAEERSVGSRRRIERASPASAHHANEQSLKPKRPGTRMLDDTDDLMLPVRRPAYNTPQKTQEPAFIAAEPPAVKGTAAPTVSVMKPAEMKPAETPVLVMRVVGEAPIVAQDAEPAPATTTARFVEAPRAEEPPAAAETAAAEEPVAEPTWRPRNRLR